MIYLDFSPCVSILVKRHPQPKGSHPQSLKKGASGLQHFRIPIGRDFFSFLVNLRRLTVCSDVVMRVRPLLCVI